MEAGSAATQKKRRRRRIFLAVLVVAALTTGAYAVNYVYNGPKCEPLTPPGCAGFESPAIQSAQVGSSHSEESNCQFERINAITWETVCGIYVNGGDTATVNLTVSGSKGGASLVDFWVYSSLPSYINFTAIPSCAYTNSTPPLNEAATCNITAASTQTFLFVLTVSQSYGTSSQREPASITVLMDQVCCFP